VKKRSVRIGKHRTSVSLEDAFWEELARIAAERGQSVNTLVAENDRQRTPDLTNLSSAIRLFVLDDLRRRRDRSSGPTP
jgi:predicted DNA-binding ribbon-helix-helix protein